MKNTYFSMDMLSFIGDDCDILADLLFKVPALYVYTVYIVQIEYFHTILLLIVWYFGLGFFFGGGALFFFVLAHLS